MFVVAAILAHTLRGSGRGGAGLLSEDPAPCAYVLGMGYGVSDNAVAFVSLHVHPTPQDVDLRHAACRALEAILTPLGGRSMHDPANGLLRIPLPRTPVNNGKNEGSAVARFTSDIY